MAAVNFTRAPADRVRITLSPRRRNYRAMSTASQTSACLHPITAPPSPSPGLASLLFERASSSWWDPKFDSEVLESQLRQTAFPHVRRRFRFALAYGCLVSAAWALYAAFHLRGSLALGVGLTGASTVLLLLVTSLITRHRIYKLQPLGVGLTATLILFGVSWAAAAVSPRLSTAGVFSLAVAVLLVMYAAFPMPLYVCVMSGLFYSLMFESIVLVTGNWSLDSSWFVVRVVLHVAVHLLGMHLFIMTQVRMRSTFLKVGQSALVRRDLEMEKALKEKMIASVMPPRVAAWLLAEGPAEDEEIEQADGTIRKLSSPRASNAASTAHSTTKATTNNLQGSLFRPFNMNKMDDVSILFADIVGFTRMSSNKSAEQLVGLLNDLFGRFDALCARLGCEKISTLGDCYYCVSGCPEPRSDHARCCVRMGLAMIDAVHKFGTDHQEDFEGTGEGVNMRVGVHTGTVLCGVVGTKRFKFDVWSNDVTTANRMESTGKAGRVHISQKTYSYLQEDYYVEEGELYKEMKTYFIIGAKNVLDGLATADSCPWAHQDSLDVDKTAEQQVERNSDDEAQLPPIIINEENGTAPTVIEGQMLKKNSLTQSWSTLNSRKDSGIRSRRSSIQAQLMENGGLATTDLLMINVHDDDLYASSQYSGGDDGLSQENTNPRLLHHPSASSENYFDLNIPLNESLTRFHLLRKQSDIQMIKCIQRNSTHADYFMRPPINPLTLFFVDPEIEFEYRQRVHRQDEAESTSVSLTLASPTFNTYLDILIAAVVYVIVTFSCFLLFDTNAVSLVFCCLATSWLLFVVALCIRRLLLARFASSCLQKMYDTCTSWYPWHMCGAVLIALPVVSVASSSTCNVWRNSIDSAFFCCIFFVAIIHFCNFTQLNCWMKSGLATLSGIALLVLLCVDVCHVENAINIKNHTGAVLIDAGLWNGTENTTGPVLSADVDFDLENDELGEHGEAAMAVLLLLLLVWYVNREYEISYRISFHGNLLAERDQQTIQLEKDQADWLLHNIIPRHVAEYIKTTSKYSENHENVGVLFASIINFNEMYDESYRGGCECLRVLNEVIGDFDELLHRAEFKNVEKIKTIGTTFMAASGLNPKIRQQNVHPHQHLFELMDFALALQRVIDAFNADLLGFSFIVRIGYNFGDVTAGVIGTTKLYYDIWSDDVNIASRMDSTGVAGRIQVPKKCVEVLGEIFDFEHRGIIYVKGKDNMDVYLLVRKKEEADYRTPRETDANVVVSAASINR